MNTIEAITTAIAALQTIASALRFIQSPPEWTVFSIRLSSLDHFACASKQSVTTGSGEIRRFAPEQGKCATLRHESHPLRGAGWHPTRRLYTQMRAGIPGR